jgi:fructose transport system ATP-binding protein
LKLGYNEILAVVGDNGAGKSTLMKVVSGAILPDSETIYFEGRKIGIKSSQDSLALGIQMCYQDLALINCLDIQ